MDPQPQRHPARPLQVAESDRGKRSWEPVYIVEGERDVHSLEALGLVATCCPGGAGKWSDEFAAYFAEAATVILPDNDEAGRAHALRVAKSLLWIAELVKVIELPGLGDKGDVTEWLDAGGTRDELERLARAADEFTVAQAGWSTSWGVDMSEGQDAPPALMARTDGCNMLYAGKLHWLQGEPESGKTFFALAAVAEALSAGRVALFIDFEDSRASVIGRLHDMGADTARFVYVRPTEPLEGDAVKDAQALMALDPTVVVLDGVTEAMALHGLDPIRAVDTAEFVHEILDRFRDPGVMTIAIDHVARGDAGKGRYAYGSQHKGAAVDGVAYRFEIIQVFSRDQGGAARIDVAKDRPGFVRSFALNKERAGVLRVVPGDELKVFVEPPTPAVAEADDGPSYTQQRVLDTLDEEGVTAGLTYHEIGDRLASDGKGSPLKRATIQKAIDALTEKGLADGTRTEGREPSRFWRL